METESDLGKKWQVFTFLLVILITFLPVSCVGFHCCDISCSFADCNQTHFCSIFREGTPDSVMAFVLIKAYAVSICTEMSGAEHNTALFLWKKG